MNNKTILHLGAGKCREIDNYLATDAKKIVLVEANPDIYDFLTKEYGSTERIEICNYAVSESKSSQLNIFNLKDMSSLRKPTGLMDLFPGLKIVNEISIKPITPAKLVDELQLKDKEDNLLVIDIPGEELSTIKNLMNNNMLYLFPKIQLYCGVNALYEENKSSTDIIKYLTSLGYDVVKQECNDDPDRPSWIISLNHLKLENNDLVKALSESKEENLKLTSEYTQQIENLIQIREQLEKRFQDQQLQIEQLTQVTNKQASLAEDYAIQIDKVTKERNEKAKLAQDRQAQFEQLTQANNKQVALAEERAHQIDRLTKERDEKAKLAQDRQTQIEQLTRASYEQKESLAELNQQLANYKGQLKELETQHQSLAKRADELSKHKKELQQELKEAGETISLSVKLQSLKEADLKDLQQRYQESLQVQDNQYQLLTQLNDKLAAASEYFHKISTEETAVEKNDSGFREIPVRVDDH